MVVKNSKYIANEDLAKLRRLSITQLQEEYEKARYYGGPIEMVEMALWERGRKIEARKVVLIK